MYLQCESELSFYIIVPGGASSLTSKDTVYNQTQQSWTQLLLVLWLIQEAQWDVIYKGCYLPVNLEASTNTRVKREVHNCQEEIYFNQQCVKKDIVLDSIKHSLINSSISKCYKNVLHWLNGQQVGLKTRTHVKQAVASWQLTLEMNFFYAEIQATLWLVSCLAVVW
jgi:hypothetical protein